MTTPERIEQIRLRWAGSITIIEAYEADPKPGVPPPDTEALQIRDLLRAIDQLTHERDEAVNKVTTLSV